MIGAGQSIVDLIRSWVSDRSGAQPPRRFLAVTYPGLAGFCLVLAVLLLGSHLIFGLEDDGYLWYGAQRVLAGEIPLRDFQSYDPGRYYWSAAVMALLGSHGLTALHVAASLCAAIGAGLACRLVFRHRAHQELWLVLMVAFTFALWMCRWYKLYDVTASVLLVASLAWLIEHPTRYRCFMAGVGVGLVAIIGRNHGLYGTLAEVVALACLTLVEKRIGIFTAFLCWSAGMLVGYAPMVLAALVVPGFWIGLWATIHVYFEVGATSFSEPVPWPWLVPHTAPMAEMARYILVGILLIVQPVVGVAVTGYQVWCSATRKTQMNPLLLATGLLAIFYTHHAFAPPGLGHLAESIFPLLICSFALVMSLPRRAELMGATAICAISAFLLLPIQPLYVRWTHQENLVAAKVGTDTFYISPFTAKRVVVLTALIDKYAPAGREFLAEPFVPAAYALVDRRAAAWNVYPIYPADTEVEAMEIRRIETERPAFVLVTGGPFAYSTTNPLVFSFITQHFTKISDPAVPPWWGWVLYIPDDSTKGHAP